MSTITIPQKKKNLYRLYIDEVGNHDMKDTISKGERFLTLFGVIASYEEMVNTIIPEMRRIKFDHFNQDQDEPIIFHRKEIVTFKGDFACLGDKDKRISFGNRMLEAYDDWNYLCVVVTIDKANHSKLYGRMRFPPYHYCLEVLLERYVLFMYYRNFRGDVMAESRNKTLDKKLKKTFRRLYENGTSHVKTSNIQKCLTSKNIKLKKKKANIAGLQLADMLAHPSYYDLCETYGIIKEQKSEYGSKVSSILREKKYYRNNASNEYIGYGMKLLP